MSGQTEGKVMRLREGTRLGSDFLIEEYISRGGFGQVYRAKQLSLNRDVAVKIMKYDPRWQNDAEVLVKINAAYYLPQVYTKFDVEAVDGSKYICLVMEFIRGIKMSDAVIKNPAGTDIEQVITWMCQLCDALTEMHNKNIIHADVKPQNIMIDSEGRVCLIDFNTAVIDGHIGEDGLCWSDGYSPPEVYPIPVYGAKSDMETKRPKIFGTAHDTTEPDYYIRGKIDKTSDIYSAGAVLYFLMFGRHPNTSKNRIDGNFIKERSGLDKKHTPIYKVIEKATAIDPERRYKSAKELKEAVETARRKMTAGYKKFMTAILACIIAGVLIISGGAVFTAAKIVGNIRAEEKREREASELCYSGFEYIQSGNTDKAEEIYSENINGYGEHIFLYALRTEILIAKGEYGSVIDEYKKFPDFIKNYKGKHVDYYALILFNNGEAYYYTGDYKQAAEYYRKAAETDGKQIDYKLALMRMLAESGDTNGINNIWEGMPDSADTNWLLYYEGVAKRVTGNLSGAEEAFAQIEISVTTNEQLSWAVVYELLKIYSETGNDAKQIEFLSNKSDMFPSAGRKVIIAEHLGESLKNAERLEEALNCFEYWTETQPYSYRAQMFLAQTLTELGRYEDAQPPLDRLITLLPNDLSAYLLYIELLFKIEEQKPETQRNYSNVYRKFLTAEQISPNDIEIQNYRQLFIDLINMGMITE